MPFKRRRRFRGRRRFLKRRRRFRRRPSTFKRRIYRALAARPRPEVKYSQSVTSVPQTITDSILIYNCLTDLNQDVDAFTRVGNEITLKKIHMHVRLTQNAPDDIPTWNTGHVYELQMFVIRVRNPYLVPGTSISYNSFFTDETRIDSHIKPKNWNDGVARPDFTVLYKKNFYVPSTTRNQVYWESVPAPGFHYTAVPNTGVPWVRYINLRFRFRKAKVVWRGNGLATDAASGQIYLGFRVPNSSTARFQFLNNTMMYFTDS